MTCRYENERLKEKKIEKISKISGSLRKKIYLKAEQIQKISKRKIFSTRSKSTATTIKRESSQVEKKKHHRTPPLLGVSFTPFLSFTPLIPSVSYTPSIVKPSMAMSG